MSPSVNISPLPSAAVWSAVTLLAGWLVCDSKKPAPAPAMMRTMRRATMTERRGRRAIPDITERARQNNAATRVRYENYRMRLAARASSTNTAEMPIVKWNRVFSTPRRVR